MSSSSMSLYGIHLPYLRRGREDENRVDTRLDAKTKGNGNGNGNGTCGAALVELLEPLERLNDAFREEEIVQIAAGKDHALLLTGSGEMWTFGSGSHGKTGQGDTAFCMEPVRVYMEPTDEQENSDEEKRVLFVAAGRSSSMCITSSFSLYAWGDGRRGQLGNGKPVDVFFPEKVRMDTRGRKIYDCACGDSHAALQLETGEMLTWGDGESYALGQIEASKSRFTPHLVPFLANLLLIGLACGAESSAAMSDDGRIFVWGSNRFGELGQGHTKPVPRPTEVRGFEEGGHPAQVAFGVGHMLISTDEGRVFSSGLNVHGQLGTSDTKHRYSLCEVKGLPGKCVRIGASGCYSVVLCDDGILYIWGRIPGTSITLLNPCALTTKSFAVHKFACADDFLLLLTTVEKKDIKHSFPFDMDEVEEAAKEIFERHAASVPSMDSSSLFLSDLDLYLSAIDAFFDYVVEELAPTSGIDVSMPRHEEIIEFFTPSGSVRMSLDDFRNAVFSLLVRSLAMYESH